MFRAANAILRDVQASLALETHSDLLGGLHLFPKHRLGLSTETSLLPVVTAFTCTAQNVVYEENSKHENPFATCLSHTSFNKQASPYKLKKRNSPAIFAPVVKRDYRSRIAPKTATHHAG